MPTEKGGRVGDWLRWGLVARGVGMLGVGVVQVALPQLGALQSANPSWGWGACGCDLGGCASRRLAAHVDML